MNPQGRLRSRSSARSGFTLIELLMVVVIISILAAIVLPRLVGRKEQAQKAAAQQTISNIDTALHMFETDNSSFPSSEEGLAALVSDSGKSTGSDGKSTWKGPYLPKVPLDPWGHPYVYKCPGSNKDFDLYSCGPSGQDQSGGGDNIEN